MLCVSRFSFAFPQMRWEMKIPLSLPSLSRRRWFSAYRVDFLAVKQEDKSNKTIEKIPLCFPLSRELIYLSRSILIGFATSETCATHRFSTPPFAQCSIRRQWADRREDFSIRWNFLSVSDSIDTWFALERQSLTSCWSIDGEACGVSRLAAKGLTRTCLSRRYHITCRSMKHLLLIFCSSLLPRERRWTVGHSPDWNPQSAEKSRRNRSNDQIQQIGNPSSLQRVQTGETDEDMKWKDERLSVQGMSEWRRDWTRLPIDLRAFFSTWKLSELHEFSLPSSGSTQTNVFYLRSKNRGTTTKFCMSSVFLWGLHSNFIGLSTRKCQRETTMDLSFLWRWW